jgi:hypothetical protein
MTGTIALPDAISIQQSDIAPSVTVVPPAPINEPAPGLPPYPLSASPNQTWSLQLVNGVLTWVQYALAPTQQAFALEDGLGVILLEDGDGVILLEL